MESLSTQPNVIPPLEPVELVPNNTMKINAGSTDGLQDTLRTLLQKITQMENFVTNLQTTQVQNWSRSPPSRSYNAREYDRDFAYASADQERNGEIKILCEKRVNHGMQRTTNHQN